MKGIFIMLIGISGAGKSYYANKLKEDKNNVMVLSSDKIREELWGDEECQREPKKVFQLMEQRAIAALNMGMTVVYDATNIEKSKRIATLAKIKPHTCYSFCIVCEVDIEEAKARQYCRKRFVPFGVIERQYVRMHNEFPTADEGWDDIRLR